MRPRPNILVLDRKVRSREARLSSSREWDDSLLCQVRLDEVLFECLNKLGVSVLVRIVIGIKVGSADCASIQTAFDYSRDLDGYHCEPDNDLLVYSIQVK